MLLDIAKLPIRIARRIVRTLVPKKDGVGASTVRDTGVSYTPASGGLRRPPEAVKAAPKPAAAHSHDHGHSHSHEHAAPASKPQVEVYSERTPNPNAMKFTVDRKVVDKGSLSFNSAAEAEGSTLGEALFKVVGVKSIFAVNDFVTVTKEDSADWAYLEGAITNAIQSAF